MDSLMTLGSKFEKALRSLITPAIMFSLATGISAQAPPDLDFRYEIDAPSFEHATGPVICFDAAHQNFHAPDGAYEPLVRLVASDGYRTRTLSDPFDEAVLRGCHALVVATPIHPSNRDEWAFPHRSAFETDEIRALHDWTRRGGGLFLVFDHSPIPGAVADLAAVFGLSIFDGEARNDTHNPLPDLFSKADQTLRDHPTTRGRRETEAVTTFATWTGAAFRASREFQPIVVYGPLSRMWAELPDTLPDLDRSEFPVFEIEGWLGAAARDVGKGRLVALAEASACTALIKGQGQKQGMNTESGGENPRLCLNFVRWLTGVIEPRPAAE